ncbi:MAG: glycosyltransferase family 2 protein [Candidatus Bathyarchaeia archaeon]
MVESSNLEIDAEALKAHAGEPFVIVGIPAFNEEKTIAKVVLKAQKFADKVLVCDDGSSDMTCEIAESLGAEVVRHEQNMGYGAALRSLFKRAKELNGDVLVTLDADGQHDPAEIPAVAKPVIEGEADIAIGSRFLDERSAKAMPWYRKAGVKLVTALANNHAKYGVEDAQSGFRAYSREALEKLSLVEDGMGVSLEILVNAKKRGLRVKEVSASCLYGGEVESSTYNPLRHGAELVMSFVRLVVEEKPLTFLGVPGLVLLLAGAFFGAWMLQIYAAEHHIVTNIALAAIAFTLIGLFMLFASVTLYAISRLSRRLNGRS